ncbi:hypothetical protein LOC71_16205 [Rhodopirellula sp. JC740]|uniref:Uncharacterized protein n=1 Tax=Rhodopirellula halodulae TaxID=2894198 RepID=A0ABS8NJV9_9BACT|nr:hypothetical protein [Rhodopirellula sp. JC740]MCC9643830.1 hypothetical protein [Rhodopirellula sp. JC740]
MRWCHRRIVLSAVIASQVLGSFATSSASACCLTDWLYGKQPAYVAGYAPVAGAPVTTITTTGTPAVAPPPAYVAGYTPLITAAPNSSVLPLNPSSIYTPSQPYSLQRPAYGAVPLDNPSVYTGQPVMSGYRGAVSTGSSIFGTGNVYPSNGYVGASPVATQPVTAYRPANTYATPVRSGLSRFFNSLLGTGYRSSYYTAPITYYRPATTVDPVTGTTVTVQRACDSTVQQLQRTPYTTFQGLASQPVTVSPYTVTPTDPCMTTVDSCGVATSAAPMTSPYGVAPVNQTVPMDSYAAQPAWGQTPSASNIPSTIDPNGYGGVAQTGDLQPMAPPASTPSNLQPFRPDEYTPSPLTGSSMTPPSSEPPASPSDPPPASQYRYSFDPPARADNDTSGSASEPSTRSSQPAEDNYNSDLYDSYRYRVEPSQDDRSSEQSPSNANPNSSEDPNSLDGYLSRSQLEVLRDREDLRRLTSGNQAVNAPSAAPRVRPIPAPEGYQHAFGDYRSQAADVPAASPKRPSTAPVRSIPSLSPPAAADNRSLRAPDLLPALPPPPASNRNDYEQARTPGFSTEDNGLAQEGPVQWGYQVREASLSERRPSDARSLGRDEPIGDYLPVRQPSSVRQPSLRQSVQRPTTSQPAPAKPTQESGWHPLNR